MDSPVAIVTGGAQGLGAAICLSLLKEGYRVCVADINENEGEQFLMKHQKKYSSQEIKFVVCDVCKEEDFKGVFAFALKAFKRLDLIVNNAGIDGKNSRTVVDVNLMGTIIGCQLAVQYMSKAEGGNGGAVINIASLAGLCSYPQSPVYAATKHGVVGLTRSYGNPENLERDGIVFTALCPTCIDTKLVHQLESTILLSKTYGLLTPEEAAQGVLKLLQDRINGSIFIITKLNGSRYVGYQEEVLESITKVQSLQTAEKTNN